MNNMSLIAGKKSDEMLEYLLKRRSVSVKNLAMPAPSPEQIQTILTVAARVPDHGKTVPFYFIVFEGEMRKEVGQIIARHYKVKNPEAPQDKIETEEERFLRAPLVIGVIYRPRRGKHPIWEQMMSVGAVCQNLILAVNASGFGANWLSEWYAYDEDFKRELGLDSKDIIAGFIHIGTVTALPEERERPNLDEIVTRWKSGVPLNKGDAAEGNKFDFPTLGFDPGKLRD
jgi:nitroreductase